MPNRLPLSSFRSPSSLVADRRRAIVRGRGGLAAVALALSPLACTVADGADAGPPTYFKDAKVVLDTHCTSCHHDGGAAPFALETYEQAKSYSASILDSVEAGRMPPWLPDPDCHTYPGQRVMTDAEKQVLVDWVDAEHPEGDPSDAVVVTPPPIDLDSPDRQLALEQAYTPVSDRPDDYRCMLVEGEFDVDTWIQGYQVVPDQRAIVHHVLLYVIPPESLEEFQAADDADPGPGFNCFSDPGVDSSLIGTWVPGTPATNLPNRLGFPAPAGSRIGVQMHYNLLAGDPVADRTAVHLKTTTTQPDYEALNAFLLDDDLRIPAGAAAHTVVKEIENPFPFPVTITSVLPHMHLLGTKIRLDHIDAAGNETCLVDIPRWDFNWQQTYDFDPSDFIVVEPGEKTRITCTYDNSAANQPFINGEQAEPVEVTWGEGTLDEMCLVIITAVADRL